MLSKIISMFYFKVVGFLCQLTWKTSWIFHFFWETQLIGHFAFLLLLSMANGPQYQRGNFGHFPNLKSFFRGLSFNNTFVNNVKKIRVLIYVSIKLGPFLGILHIFLDQFQNILHNNHFIYTFYLGSRCEMKMGVKYS